MSAPSPEPTPDRIRLHPEAVPADPATLRWIVPAGLLGMVGPVGAAPAPLEALRADGTVRAVVAEPAALRLTLGEGLTWRADGARVRAALEEALAAVAAGEARFEPEVRAAAVPGPGGAVSVHDGAAPVPAAPTGAVASDDPDAVLAAAVGQVLAGPAGEYLRSHGGTVRVVSARDREVVLDLGGTCHSCPARDVTLRRRLEAELRRLVPDLREMRTL